MANTFRRYTKNSVGTTLQTVMTVSSPVTATIVIGGIASNTGNSSVTMEVIANDGTNDINLTGKDTVIPEGSALSFVEGKIVMQTGDTIRVKASAPIDVQLSVMEIT